MNTTPQPHDPSGDVDITPAAAAQQPPAPGDTPALTTDAEAQTDDPLIDPSAS